MAHAKARVLTYIRGSIDNTAPHYAFVRNGKQFIGCVRKGWNTELTTDTQKITALNFAYASAISAMVHAVYKAGQSRAYTRSISYLFRHCRVGKREYFFDESLFPAVNAVLSRYFAAPQFFTLDTIFHDDADNALGLYAPCDKARSILDATKKTAFRYQFASMLMDNAARLNLPQLYDDLSKVSGAAYDPEEIYPLQDVYEVYRLLRLDLCRWASIPVLPITPQNYDRLLQHKANGTDHRLDFPALASESQWR